MSIRRRTLVAGLAGMGLYGPVMAQQAAGEPPALPPAKTDHAARLTLPVMVNGQGPFAFLVDTGSNRSVISAELAVRLNLEAGAGVAVHGISGAVRAPTVNVRSLTTGGLYAPVAELPLLPVADLDAEGLLGVDAFRDRRLTLDLRTNEVSLALSTHGRALLKTMPREATVPARQRFGQLTIIDATAGGEPVSCFIDTGSQDTVGNTALFRRIRPEKSVAFAPFAVRLHGATGQFRDGTMAYVPEIRVGEVRLDNTMVVFTDLHTFELWGLTERPALLLGMDMLRLFDRVVIDFGRRSVTFAKA